MLPRVIRPLAAADVGPSADASAFPGVVDLTVATDEVLGIVGFVAAAHLLAVVLDLQMSAAANVALGVVGLRAAAGSHPGSLDARFEGVGAADPLGTVVSGRGTRLTVHALVLHEVFV